MQPTLKTSIRLGAGSVVCAEADLKGEVVIGPRTFIHPKAKIIAEGGPITIGEGNLIEEQVVIHNKPHPNGERIPLSIGSYNVFEVGCTIESQKIGDNNVFECKSVCGRNTEVKNGCSIGAACVVESKETLVDNTVIYGENCLRKNAAERPPTQTLLLDFLCKMMPTFHHLKKPKSAASAT